MLEKRMYTVQTTAEPGRHEMRLDVSTLSSEVYVLRLQAGAATKTRKLTIIQ